MSIADISQPSQIGLDSNGMLMTPDEYAAIEQWDENYRYELVHGVLIVTPPPGIGERKPNDVIGHWLQAYQEMHPEGSHLDDTAPEHDITTKTGCRRADRVIWAGLGRLPNYRRDVPTIAIEFVSDSHRDRKRDDIEKREEYAAVGVREYWIIDRFRRTMTVFCGTETERVVGEGETYKTELLPGFELQLSRLLEIADRVTGE